MASYKVKRKLFNAPVVKPTAPSWGDWGRNAGQQTLKFMGNSVKYGTIGVGGLAAAGTLYAGYQANKAVDGAIDTTKSVAKNVGAGAGDALSNIASPYK